LQYVAKGLTPRLFATVLEAWDEPQAPRDEWLIIMRGAPGNGNSNMQDFIEHAGQIGARNKIVRFVPGLFTAPYRDFSDVILGVRVRPVGGAWSTWHDLQPPRYPAVRLDLVLCCAFASSCARVL
jgi:hypothetical protein